ncbi:MAG: N-acetylmuramoyl-L-alanine amidase [Bacteroidaceae bacterium]|nr:N-acetylmuramoyl-L-alanine amidase [Bacteroidaceae bacterium]
MRNHKHILRIIMAVLCLMAVTPAHAVDKDGKFVLVIDPGHGGKDPGAINGRNQEKAINLNVAIKMGKLIEDNCKDVKVIYTRKTDVFVELYKRADIANKASADMFISIHTNSAKNKSANGAETYLLGVEENRTSANLNAALEENKAILLENDYQAHYEGYDPNSPESMIIFEFMQNEYQKESLKMATFTQSQMVKSAKRPDRGVHQAGYLVLWKSTMPSILVELGFISNDAECKYLVSQKGVEEMSQSLYKAFKEYLDYHNKLMDKAVPATQAIGNDGSKKEKDNSTAQAVPVYKVQFMSLKTPLKDNDKRLKAYSNVSYYTEGGMCKYTCGDTSDYDEILRTKNEVQKNYKDAFVIAVYKGKKISVKEAREITSKNK